ncbi:LOW QUALITY PROTEIN: nuclear body protein SP140-like protein [Sphaeramia orbicularis]|uniref:LOW QUALITY PROTEIN: nuclear body protein SP140-like protein n=1 Tax=Sphaeramia orbicularis TaxID=375764 RepID=UPI0011812B64|nr:LOW QUALITY PROTEIN: nuclear body protein SP140-like protein [Sphaeramia orbicularis]
MDPIEFMEHEELLRFFHRHKTEMSLMENPQTLLNQLRDYNLIPEDRYKKVSRMRSKANMKNGMYDLLDWLERERSDHIGLFWRCVFKDSILNQYVTLQKLRNSLLDGSFQFEPKLPEKLEKEETEGKRKEPSEEENGKENSVKKKKKNKTRSVGEEDDDEEQAGPSGQAAPAQKKKSKKLCFSSPLKRGEKGNIWTWDIFKDQIPVTCGDKEGFLNRQRLAKGEKCIAVGRQWYTPGEFEKFAGKASCKNWKLNICCEGTTLGKLIQEGHLKVKNFKRRTKAKKSLFSDRVPTGEGDDDFDEEEQDSSSDRQNSTNTTEEEDDAGEQTEEQSDDREDVHKTVFKVTCGDVAAMLHKERFVSGILGKCIRTEKSWMTPVDFVKEVLCETDVSWKKDIICEGKPLGDLIEKKILSCHSLFCDCRLCAPDSEDLDDQKNDDECWICRREGKLVQCDYCPRSFHQTCHLPHVEDAILEDDQPWMCMFCVFTKYKESFSSMETTAAALSCNISEHMLQCQYLLLHLYNTDQQQIFATNPTLYLSDQTTVVTTPMWFGRVAEKLQEKQYQTVGDFVSDVHLIFTNCASYNRDNPEFTAMGVTLKEFFDREFENAFKIQEETADS